VRALCDQTQVAKMHFSALRGGPARWPAPAGARRRGGNARSLPKHLQKAVPEAARAQHRSSSPACEAHVCLLQTALDLLEAEFDVWVVTDACGSRTERNRDAAYDRLAGNGRGTGHDRDGGLRVAAQR
jgi:hypothetical protein